MKQLTKKIIYNPVTDTCYEVATKSTKHGKKGEIKGMWPANKQNRKKVIKP